jgi:hypothetical protein
MVMQFAKEQFIVDEKGNPQAVVLGIEEYRKIMSILQGKNDRKESKILSQSKVFKKLVQRGLKEVHEGKVRPWKEAWDEL